jgi:hypothetical protein
VLKRLAAVAALLAATPAVAQPLTQPSTAAQPPTVEAQPAQPAAAIEAQKDLAEDYTMELARSMLHGEKPSPGLPDGVVTAAVFLEVQLQARLDVLLRSNLTGADLVNAVRAIDNSTANTLQDVIDNRVALPNGPRGFLIAGLAETARPSWNEGQFKWAQEFKDQRALTSAQRMAEDAAQILGALKALPSNMNIPTDAWNAFVDGQITDPAYTTLFKAWRLYTMEYVRLAWDVKGDVTPLLKDAPIYGTLSTVRDTLKRNTAAANEPIKSSLYLWHQEGMEGEAPGYSPEAEAIFNAIERMDPETGEISGDVPPQLRDAVPAPVRQMDDRSFRPFCPVRSLSARGSDGTSPGTRTKEGMKC